MADYAELSDLRAYLRITDAEDTADDVFLTLALGASSRAIERACNRVFHVTAASATARLYRGRFDGDLGRYVIDIDDLMTTNGLLIKSSTGTDGVYPTDHGTYRMAPLNAPASERPWSSIILPSGETLPSHIGSVEVTAKWGWTAIPATVKNACLLQAARLFKRRDAPFGVAGSPEMGNMIRLLPKLDPDVDMMLGDYRRWWAAA